MRQWMNPPTERFKNKPLTTSFVVTWSQSSLRNWHAPVSSSASRSDRHPGTRLTTRSRNPKLGSVAAVTRLDTTPLHGRRKTSRGTRCNAVAILEKENIRFKPMSALLAMGIMPGRRSKLTVRRVRLAPPSPSTEKNSHSRHRNLKARSSPTPHNRPLTGRHALCRRFRFRRDQHVRRRDTDDNPRPHRSGGIALHQLQLHGPVLSDTCRSHHRTQPSLGRFRCDLRAGDRIPRLRQLHHSRQGDHRPHPQRQRLQHLSPYLPFSPKGWAHCCDK